MRLDEPHREKKRIVFYVLYFLLFGLGTAYVVNLRTQFADHRTPENLAALSPKPIDKRLTIIGMEGLSIDLLIEETLQGTDN